MVGYQWYVLVSLLLVFQVVFEIMFFFVHVYGNTKCMAIPYTCTYKYNIITLSQKRTIWYHGSYQLIKLVALSPSVWRRPGVS
jgi:hypothetical protein